MSTPKYDDLINVSMRIFNSSEHPMTVILEPWGDEHELAPKEAFEVRFRATTLAEIPMSINERTITIEGWEGSTGEIWHKGNLMS